MLLLFQGGCPDRLGHEHCRLKKAEEERVKDAEKAEKREKKELKEKKYASQLCLAAVVDS